MPNSLYHRLKNNYVFHHLDSYAFRVVENYFLFKSLQKDEYLFHEGQYGDFVAFVLYGQLQVLKPNLQGQPKVLSTITTGECIGEMAIIDELTRSASVRATEMTALVVLPKKDFDHILHEYPLIGIEMLKGLAVMLSLNLRRTSENLSQQMG